MSDLSRQELKLCRKSTPPLSAEGYADLLVQIPDWFVQEAEGVKRLQRSYFFTDAIDAATFSQFIKTMADEVNHHPYLFAQDNRLTVLWWTHTIKGLHLNDFIMAARCDELYGRISKAAK